jgi:hypothetical protein
MLENRNPFIDLYVTENISAKKFVSVFSPILIEEGDTHALFQPGNVLLTGLQGSGKTALLNLLKPEILIAYLEANQAWPIPTHCSKFISGGINLTKSGAMEFGQRQIEQNSNSETTRVALHFADFINFWIIGDLLDSVEKISRHAGASNFLGLRVTPSLLNDFASKVSKQSFWLGSIEATNDYGMLRQQLQARIIAYRNFLNYNTEILPVEIRQTKTSAGEPISGVVDCLKELEIIPAELPVLIRIDQFEDLAGLESVQNIQNVQQYRQVVFRMLGMRDSRVSYRIGSRPYSVPNDMRMLGTNSAIEESRNYKSVDIDSILRRKEHRVGPFPKLAEDVFRRRLAEADIAVLPKKKSMIRQIFGRRPLPAQRAKMLVQDSELRLRMDDVVVKPEVLNSLRALALTDPLSAKLGEAWIRQKQKKSEDDFVLNGRYVWQTEKAKWWRKERIEQSLLQIAAIRSERMAWSGDDDIIGLSGGNILVFLNVCQLIWAEHLRSGPDGFEAVPQIHGRVIQSLGIYETSQHWFRKIAADANGGDDRSRFIKVLGTELRNMLRDDKNMSYPGANGFSLSMQELDGNRELEEFLESCVAYGVLTVARHTSKTKSRGQSKKWYLFPILCPYFQIPVAHTKEPFYASVIQLETWLKKADVNLRSFKYAGSASVQVVRKDNKDQLSLFPTNFVGKK